MKGDEQQIQHQKRLESETETTTVDAKHYIKMTKKDGKTDQDS